MALLVLGSGSRLDWVKVVIEALRGSALLQSPLTYHVVDEAPTRELLVCLSSEVIDRVILIDPFPAEEGYPGDREPAWEALRANAQRAVFALELARRHGPLLVLRGTDTPAWVTALAEVFSTPAPDPSMFAPLPPPNRLAIDGPLVAGYLRPLWDAVRLASPLNLIWPRECFFDGDAPGNPLPAAIEVAGRARILAYGPYLPLPSGVWLATAFLGFSPDIGSLSFIIEVDTGGAVSRNFFEVEMGGFFTLEFEFQVIGALCPVEIRLISQDSALEGQIALIEVRLEQSL